MKIRFKYQSSPVEASKHQVISYTQKPNKLLFHHNFSEQPSNEVSRKKVVAAVGGENLPDKDITYYEWAM